MKLGFFTMPIHPLGKDWRVSLQEDREAFVLAATGIVLGVVLVGAMLLFGLLSHGR